MPQLQILKVELQRGNAKALNIEGIGTKETIQQQRPLDPSRLLKKTTTFNLYKQAPIKHVPNYQVLDPKGSGILFKK